MSDARQSLNLTLTAGRRRNLSIAHVTMRARFTTHVRRSFAPNNCEITSTINDGGMQRVQALGEM